MTNKFYKCLLISSVLIATNANADRVVVDKIYHPYVLPLEQEIEWRFTINERNDFLNEEKRTISQRIGYGHSLSENITLEGYIVGQRIHDEQFNLQAYELELRWMITEQGKYPVDWGMLFEIEKQHNESNYAVKTGVLAETEMGKSSLTANLFAIYEYGDTIVNEWDPQFSLQYRYRLKPELQPSIELYTGENYVGLGPAVMGIQRFNKKKQLKWEAGFIFGLSNESSNNTLRIAIEYEF